MANRFAIDFGTSNTRAAIWDDAAQQAMPLVIPDISLLAEQTDASGNSVSASYVPSLIHYDDQKIWIGSQVREQGKLESPATFRRIKHYISNKLELPRQVKNRQIKYSEAGADFLSMVINYAASLVGLDDEEVAFTVPVEVFEHYQDWLSVVCEKAGISRYRMLDEASAAALGYGVHIQANDVYMVFDFGG
ncbi:MAG: Hsp70 family protein, partial [bacterium]|nr:Hsp70 family protein [bacterium]